MDREFLVVNQKATAFYPFPCPVYIEKTADPKPKFQVYCGSYVMAVYDSMVPAKMELDRLLSTWLDVEQRYFRFAKVDET